MIFFYLSLYYNFSPNLFLLFVPIFFFFFWLVNWLGGRALERNKLLRVISYPIFFMHIYQIYMNCKRTFNIFKQTRPHFFFHTAKIVESYCLTLVRLSHVNNLFPLSIQSISAYIFNRRPIVLRKF